MMKLNHNQDNFPDDLFSDVQTRTLAVSLSHISPDVLYVWGMVVCPLKHRWLQEQQKYEELLAARKLAVGVLISYTEEEARHQLWNYFKGIPSVTVKSKKTLKGIDLGRFQPKKLGLQLISGGLSFMQVLAISELVGVQVRDLEPSDVPLFTISVVAALSLTFGAKEALIRWIKIKRKDDLEMPFWRLLFKGDTLAFCTVALVLLEMAFAAPGLISMLPPRQASQLLPQLTAYASSGLAAFVNVFLAYGVAFESIEFEKKFIETFSVTDHAVQSKETLHVDPESTRTMLANYDRELLYQSRVLQSAKGQYNYALQRWLKQVRRVVRSREFRREFRGKGT